MRGKNRAVVRHEDQLKNQIPVLKRIEKELNLERRGKSIASHFQTG